MNGKHEQCHRNVDSISIQAYCPWHMSHFFLTSIHSATSMRHPLCTPYQAVFLSSVVFSMCHLWRSHIFFQKKKLLDGFPLAEVTYAYCSKWNKMYKRGKLVISPPRALHSHHPDGTKVVSVVFWLRKVFQTSPLDSNKGVVPSLCRGTKASDKSDH